ncbi:hypothetical protein ACFWVP_19415 [Streptomyces sp. NPDC058637]|uniref:hypothetical protein n=1 Tax=Streptomyces sp. NPDC058637 TaxID=3346569 RepID=UPI0036698552
MEKMLAACRDANRRPPTERLAFARSLGMSNTTFRRRYPDLVEEIAAHRTTSNDEAVREPSAQDTLIARNAKLRRRNRELTAALALAAVQIQYVTLENTRLLEALEAQEGVTQLSSRPRLR